MSDKHPLTRYREQENLSKAGLAQKLGVSRAAVTRWEAGRFPEKSMWPVIREKTGVLPEELARFAEATA